MKIAFFIKSTTFHKGFGGFETQNKNLCEGLAKRGHKVVVYSPKKELGFDEKEEAGVLYKFVACRFAKFRALYSNRSDSWENRVIELFSKDHSAEKYDLVVGQSSWALPVIRKKAEFGVKVVSILHGSKIGEYQTELKNAKSLKEIAVCLRDIPHVLRAFFGTQREFVHGSEKLVAVSSFVKKSIIDETYVAESKVEVIHNGVDENKFISKADTVEETYHGDKTVNGIVKLIYVGRVIRAKGLFVLADSLKYIYNQGEKSWCLEIVGDGEALADLKKVITGSGLSDKITFTGFINYSEIIKKLSSSDVFILPSQRLEGFPMTIVEAMFTALPVIASDIGGNSDAVEDGVTGFLTEPGNVQNLAEKIQFLIKNREKRQEMGRNSRNKAVKEFTISHMLDEYERIFTEVVNMGVSK